MAVEPGRNEPCPCGSGKKYKHCHLGKELEPAARRRRAWPLFLALAGLAGGGVAFALKGPGLGIGVAAGGLLIAGIILATADPPPPSGKSGDPSAINFGK